VLGLRVKIQNVVRPGRRVRTFHVTPHNMIEWLIIVPNYAKVLRARNSSAARRIHIVRVQMEPTHHSRVQHIITINQPLVLLNVVKMHLVIRLCVVILTLLVLVLHHARATST